MPPSHQGISTHHKIRVEDGSYRTVYEGPRGGRFYIYHGAKIQLPRAGLPVAIAVRHKGGLYGYHVHASARARQSALRRAVAATSRGEVMKRVNALYVFSKNRAPNLAQVYQRDKDYIRTL